MGPRRKVVPFENKVKRSKPEIKDRYTAIVNALRQYDFNDRISVPCETFSYKKEKLIIITFSGATLKVYFKIDPSDYDDSTIPLKDATEVKKYSDTPAYLIIKSDLSVKRTIMIGEKLAKKYKIRKK